MYREPTMECGGCIKGEAPPKRDGVSQYTLSRKTTPPQHAMLQNHAEVQRAWGPMGGVHPQGGIQMCGGIQMYGGLYKHTGGI